MLSSRPLFDTLAWCSEVREDLTPSGQAFSPPRKLANRDHRNSGTYPTAVN
jgi:hypothetical protein